MNEDNGGKRMNYSSVKNKWAIKRGQVQVIIFTINLLRCCVTFNFWSQLFFTFQTKHMVVLNAKVRK